MRRVFPGALAAGIVACVAWTGCLAPLGNNGGGGSGASECNTDAACTAHGACTEAHCEQHKCVERDAPEGAAPSSGYDGLACQKAVCDGKGGVNLVPDPTALPATTAPTCKRYTCDNSGNAVLEPDPTNTGGGSATPCQKITCDNTGTAVLEPDPGNTPPDTPGDCQKDACDAAGSVVKNPEDADTPPDSTCFSYACSGGQAVATPINPATKCDGAGYVCGADGACATCPSPDTACSDPGPGSRAAASAHDFGGIGRTDSGGRWFCGAVPAGQTEYYTYYDDETGVFSVFDPYFEIRPQVAATMCVYFDCPSISCPSSWQSAASSAGHPGCCLAASAGAFSGASIDFCAGARVEIQVTSSASCAGYELHFHD